MLIGPDRRPVFFYTEASSFSKTLRQLHMSDLEALWQCCSYHGSACVILASLSYLIKQDARRKMQDDDGQCHKISTVGYRTRDIFL